MQSKPEFEVRMKHLTPFIILLLLSACSANVNTSPPVNRASDAKLSYHPLGFYTDRIAANLLKNLPKRGLANNPNPKLAVTSFLPIEQLSLNQTDADELQLANQLAESMLSYAVNIGLDAVDFRLRQQVLLLPDHEQALSRTLDSLKQHSQADAVLTGTYVIQEDALIVNARLIDVQTNRVIAAATDYIPINVFWSEQQVMKRGDYLYRHSTTGDRK